MKLYFVLACLLLVSGHSSAVDRLVEIRNKIDISDSHYGNSILGYEVTDLFKLKDNSELFIHQARFGGDGEHTGNVVKLFKITKKSISKIYEHELSTVKFVFDKGFLTKVNGYHRESLCHGCDGLDAAHPDDIFSVPLELDITNLEMRVLLNNKEKYEFMEKLKERIKSSNKDQLSYGFTDYPEYSNAVYERLSNLFK